MSLYERGVLKHGIGYDLIAVEQRWRVVLGIRCHICGQTSFHPKDISERYCGVCHVFHDDDRIFGAPRLRCGPITWKRAAQRLGEELASVGPPGYYTLTPDQWLAWCLAQVAPRRFDLGDTVHRAGRHAVAGLPERQTDSTP